MIGYKEVEPQKRMLLWKSAVSAAEADALPLVAEAAGAGELPQAVRESIMIPARNAARVFFIETMPPKKILNISSNI